MTEVKLERKTFNRRCYAAIYFTDAAILVAMMAYFLFIKPNETVVLVSIPCALVIALFLNRGLNMLRYTTLLIANDSGLAVNVETPKAMRLMWNQVNSITLRKNRSDAVLIVITYKDVDNKSRYTTVNTAASGYRWKELKNTVATLERMKLRLRQPTTY